MTVYRKTKAGHTGEVDKIGDTYVAAIFGPALSVTDLGPFATSLHAIAEVDAVLATIQDIDSEPETEEVIYAHA